ncbi:MAG TPA: universal stress protein [Ktedonobacterales bacterium]|nr:universal stress protein [Ktedonobacterales bacterium]
MRRDAGAQAARQPEPSSPATGREGRQDIFIILVPLDGSERAAGALPFAEDICQRLGGEIALIRIPPTTGLRYALAPDYIPANVYQQMVDEQRRVAREYLEHVATEMRQRGLRVQAYLKHGEPAMAIIEAIPALRVSMVVMTTHGRTGLGRFALGSVADRVVREGGAPVLLVRSFPGETQRAEPRRALVPLDGSPLAEATLFTVALRLAGAVLREITLVRVVDPRASREGVTVADEYLDQARRRFAERLNGREVAITTRTEVGAPAAGILAAARARASDVIVMSTHGEAGVGRMAFGSVTDRLLHDSDMPLLLVRPAAGVVGAGERQDLAGGPERR